MTAVAKRINSDSVYSAQCEDEQQKNDHPQLLEYNRGSVTVVNYTAFIKNDGFALAFNV